MSEIRFDAWIYLNFHFTVCRECFNFGLRLRKEMQSWKLDDESRKIDSQY